MTACCIIFCKYRYAHLPEVPVADLHLRHHLLRTHPLTQTFISITMVTGPEYYDFPVTDEVKNSNIITIFLFLLLLIALSLKWKRDLAAQSRNSLNIELTPLKERHNSDSI